MTNTQTDQLTRLKAYLMERLAEFHISSSVSLIEYKDSAVAWSEDGNVLTHSTKKMNEAIANARTLAPILLANTLREIEWLEKRINQNKMDIASGIHSTLVTLLILQSEEIGDRLNEIMESFK